VDGVDYPEFKLAKPAFHELTELHRDPRELFHMLADFAVMAARARPTLSISDAVAAIQQGGV